ncbi:single-stranded DNA-binding protein [Nocardioides sp. W3-2-3]|nr:single-stranded DNA-binding protein [Nocardioides convexus]
MMANETIVTVQGWVAGVPVLREAGGAPVLNFRIGCTPRHFNRASGQWVDSETQWYGVSAWRRLAAHAGDSLRQGGRGDRARPAQPPALRQQERHRGRGDGDRRVQHRSRPQPGDGDLREVVTGGRELFGSRPRARGCHRRCVALVPWRNTFSPCATSARPTATRSSWTT